MFPLGNLPLGILVVLSSCFGLTELPDPIVLPLAVTGNVFDVILLSDSSAFLQRIFLGSGSTVIPEPSALDFLFLAAVAWFFASRRSVISVPSAGVSSGGISSTGSSSGKGS